MCTHISADNHNMGVCSECSIDFPLIKTIQALNSNVLDEITGNAEIPVMQM